MEKEDVRSYNVGTSDYFRRRIQPWDIWEEYKLNPWDADIVKRVLRNKGGEDPRLDYEKIIHICRKCIDMLDKGTYPERTTSGVALNPQANRINILLEPDAFLPKKATSGSAAYDLYAPADFLVKPGRNIMPLGFRMHLPYGIGATPNPRSGNSSKGMEGYAQWVMDTCASGMTLTVEGEPQRMDADVTWGLIDSDYRGVCGLIIYSREKKPFAVLRGARLAQMCFQRYEDMEFVTVDRLEGTERGEGGFGHTGTM